MEEQSMKKSIVKKLLAGIVSASMILGIPVSGYSQEEETQSAVIAAEESVDATEAVLAGAGEIEAVAAETAVAEMPAEAPAEAAGQDAELILDEAVDIAEEQTEEAAAADEEEILIAADEEPEEAEEVPEDGIILEAAEEEEEVLEAAAGNVKEVGNEEALQNAIMTATEGTVIKLTQNISTIGSITVGTISSDKKMPEGTTSITIDLNSKTLKVSSSNSLFVKTGKSLTLTNGTFEGRLIVTEKAKTDLTSSLNMTGQNCMKITEGGTVDVNGATITSSVAGTSKYAIEVEKGTLNLKSGSIKVTEDDRYAVLLCDTGSVVNMTDGNIEITGNGNAVKINAGIFKISKGSVNSKGNAFELYMKGSLSISGSKDSNGDYATNVISTGGYAVYDYHQNIYDALSTDGDSVIKISGGYLEGKTTEYYPEYAWRNKIVTVKTDAVGFAHEVNRRYLPNVNCRTKDEDGDGIYTIKELTASNAAAAYLRDGNTFYTETVQEAMDEISNESYSPKDDDTVKLLKDVDEETIKVEIPRTIDLNKHTLKTKMTVEGCKVTVKNGNLQSHTYDYALMVEKGADVTLDPSLKVSSQRFAICVGEPTANTDTYKLTVKCPVTANTYPVFVYEGKSTVVLDSATLTSETSSALRVDDSTGTGAIVTVKNSKLTGAGGIFIDGGEVTVSGTTVTANGDQAGNPDPETTGTGSAINIPAGNKAKLIIKSGTFYSAKGHALYMGQVPVSGSEISGGTFKTGRANWDAVAGKPASNMFKSGSYYPNKKNAMKSGVDTANCALVGVTDGTFYVGAYNKVMDTLYAANKTATKITVGAATSGKMITGCKAHAEMLNLTGVDVSLLIGTDDKVTKNKGTLPKTADTEAWVFHNDLIKLTAAANKNATCTLPGVSADCWYCETLKKVYKAADAKEECDPGTITAAAKGHSWSAWDANGDRICSACGKKEHDASKVQPKYQISGNPKKLKTKAAGDRKLTVSWKKPAKSKLKKIKGVQIQVATDKNFTNIVKTKKVKKSKTSYTFKKLKKGQKYYVRVRYYKGSQISKWSPVKSRKVK